MHAEKLMSDTQIPSKLSKQEKTPMIFQGAFLCHEEYKVLQIQLIFCRKMLVIPTTGN